MSKQATQTDGLGFSPVLDYDDLNYMQQGSSQQRRTPFGYRTLMESNLVRDGHVHLFKRIDMGGDLPETDVCFGVTRKGMEESSYGWFWNHTSGPAHDDELCMNDIPSFSYFGGIEVFDMVCKAVKEYSDIKSVIYNSALWCEHRIVGRCETLEDATDLLKSRILSNRVKHGEHIRIVLSDPDCNALSVAVMYPMN